MPSASATSLINTPGRLLSFNAVALNRSPYLAIFLGPALATTHLRAVSPKCQLIWGKLGVGVHAGVRRDPALMSLRTAAAAASGVVLEVSSIRSYCRLYTGSATCSLAM